MKTVCIIVSVITSMLMAISAYASPLDYYDTHARGWHWYETFPDEEPKPLPPLPIVNLDNAIETMHGIQKKVEAARDLAIINPTPTNVHYYITLQNQVSSRASVFAQTWKQVLLNAPTLDENLKSPTNALARNVSVDMHRQTLDHDIQTFARHSGLFFFYRSGCPYCHRFAPILKAFAKRHQLAIIPITLDGQTLPDFPDSKIDEGQAKLFQVEVVPALFAVDPYTHQAVPVGFGLMSEDELQERISHVAKDWEKRIS